MLDTAHEGGRHIYTHNRISSLEGSTRGGWWVSLDSRIGSPAPLNKSLGSVCMFSGDRGFQPSALHVIVSGGRISR